MNLTLTTQVATYL